MIVSAGRKATEATLPPPGGLWRLAFEVAHPRRAGYCKADDAAPYLAFRIRRCVRRGETEATCGTELA